MAEGDKTYSESEMNAVKADLNKQTDRARGFEGEIVTLNKKYEPYAKEDISALKAASEGVGIALGLFPITNSWVNRGLLCCPLTKKIKSSYSHWSCAPKNYTHPATGAFHSWCKTLFDEIPPIEVSN